jgi:iron complex transport system permease protein
MKPARGLIVGAVALVIALALGIAFGTQPISLARAFSDPESLDRYFVAVRVPRVALAAVSGAGLALVGAAFQALLRNPLAEPYVLGVSGGAALGATLAIVVGLGGATLLGASIVPLAALAGGMGATAVVYGLAQNAKRAASSTAILLAGVVVNAIASAAITFLKVLVTAKTAQDVLFWLMGFLPEVPSPGALGAVFAYVALGAAILLRDAGRHNLLALGDESAEHLGVDVAALGRRTLLACSLVVGAIVSVTGLIGFVGLIVPHALRRVMGPDNRALFPASLLAGGATLVICDLASRALFRWVHRDIPVGAVTALVGGPIFLALLRRR